MDLICHSAAACTGLWAGLHLDAQQSLQQRSVGIFPFAGAAAARESTVALYAHR